MRTLHGIRQSPWTERASWALDHHGVAYAYHEHLPMLGELLLRRKARTKNALVPLLADGDRVVMGSLAIAKHAESLGGAAPLFPSGTEGELAHWADVAERITSVGRALFFRKTKTDRRAQGSLLPSFVPGALRGALAPSAGMALAFLAKKHAVADDPSAIEQVAPLLKEVELALRERRYFFSSFSYADIAIASSMQILRPRPEKVPAAVREAWGNEDLAREFSGLVRWRDAIYVEHR